MLLAGKGEADVPYGYTEGVGVRALDGRVSDKALKSDELDQDHSLPRAL